MYVYISSKIEEFDVSNALENKTIQKSYWIKSPGTEVDINLVFIIKVPTKPWLFLHDHIPSCNIHLHTTASLIPLPYLSELPFKYLEIVHGEGLAQSPRV